MALFADSPVINICCLAYNTELENNAIHLLGVGEGMFRWDIFPHIVFYRSKKSVFSFSKIIEFVYKRKRFQAQKWGGGRGAHKKGMKNSTKKAIEVCHFHSSFAHIHSKKESIRVETLIGYWLQFVFA